MEKRKIQRTGGSSLAVTLPKKWTDRFGLQDKDSLRFYSQHSGLLIIQPDSHHTQPLRTVLDVEHLSCRATARELIALYVAGSEEVLLRSPSMRQTQRNRVREVTQRLIGFEIITESSQEILIRNVLDPAKLPTIQHIGRMFTHGEAMFRDAMKAAAEHDASLARDVIDRDFEMDKLYLTLLRQYSISLQGIVHDEDVGMCKLDLSYFNNVATQLERIADHAVRIASAVVDAEGPVQNAPALLAIADNILKLLPAAAAMAHSLDKASAHAILDEDRQIEESLLLSGKSAASYQEKIVVDSLDRLRGYLMNIAESTIDQAAIRDGQRMRFEHGASMASVPVSTL